MTLSELKRLKALEEENVRLKRIIAQQALDNELLREINAKNGKPSCPKVSGEIFDEAEPMFPATGCIVVGIPRSLVRYTARRREGEAELIKRLHKLAVHHSRYGYRRITVLLRREGFGVNKKRVHRIWKSDGLGLPRRRPKRRRMGPTGGIVNKAEYPNHVWSYGFLEDRTERGGKLRILVIIGGYTRECLATRVEPSIPAPVVIEVLEWLFSTKGVPKYIRSHNGPESISKEVCQWLEESGCSSLFIKPGSPWENGYVESFNDKLRDECLNREIFRSGEEAQTIAKALRQEYDNYRPRSSPGYLTPVEFAGRYYKQSQEKQAIQLTEKAGSLSF